MDNHGSHDHHGPCCVLDCIVFVLTGRNRPDEVARSDEFMLAIVQTRWLGPTNSERLVVPTISERLNRQTRWQSSRRDGSYCFGIVNFVVALRSSGLRILIGIFPQVPGEQRTRRHLVSKMNSRKLRLFWRGRTL